MRNDVMGYINLVTTNKGTFGDFGNETDDSSSD